MKLIRYESPVLDPATSMADLREEMGRLFDYAFPTWSRFSQPWSNAGYTPAIDLYQDQEQFVLRAELPGLRKDDISIEVVNGTLVLSGERKHDEEKKDGENLVRETSQGKFHRAITLPDDVQVDRVQARYENGVLTVTLPKREEAKPKQIAIEVK